MVAYLGLAIGLAFVTCWVVPGARGRYFMPLYPCLALLVGLSVERVANPSAAGWQRRGWKSFLLVAAVLAIGAGGSIGALSWIGPWRFPALSEPSLVRRDVRCRVARGWGRAFGVAPNVGSRGIRIAILTVACFIGLANLSIVIDGTVAMSVDPAPDVAQLKEKLPAGTRLVSFGLVETLFTYLYHEPIEERPWPKTLREVGPNVDYFCFTWDRPAAPSLPFCWRIEAVIPCDRVRHVPTVKKVIIGRRIDSLAHALP